MMVFDLIILAVQAAFSPLQQCLYGIVMVIVYTVVLDKVLIFGSTRTEVKIISQHADEIREAIFSQLDRGVTILHGEGGYSRNREQVLLSVVSNRQLPKLEKIPHLLHDREPCDRSKRPRLLAGKGLQGRGLILPADTCKIQVSWGIV